MPSTTVDLAAEPTRASAPAPGLRDLLIGTAIALYTRRAFDEVSLDLVAEESGSDLGAVLELFPTRGDLLLATVEEWNGRRMAPVAVATIAGQQGAVALLRAIVIENVADGALMRLLVACANLAATPGHPIAPMLRQQWITFHAMVQRALASDVAVGREPATVDPARGTEQLIAMYEGLQLQSMLRPHMDVLEAYDRAVTRLRDGWSRDYAPPLWQI